MLLPYFHTEDSALSKLQTKWASLINPVLGLPLNQGIILPNVVLANGVTVVNHLLQRIPQGWFLVDINGAATVYRSQPFNNLTLTLTASAKVTVSLFVF